MNDHDLLIVVSTNIENIRKTQDRMDAKLDKHIEKDDTFLTKKMWAWITATLFTVICGAYAYTYEVGRDASEHQENLTIHHTTNVIEALKE